MSTDINASLAEPSDEDKAAIAAIPQRIVAAWEKYDADAFAEVFTPEGTLILPGVFEQGREAIRAFVAAAWDGPFKGTRVTGAPVSIRFAGPEAGIVITQGGILNPGADELTPERSVNASWVVVKREGQWYLGAYQNTPRFA
ncbi:SgcJ/EcaC family oxidoreductase [Streptomyces bambusae]|uniref:SgcJ/EcaC family oxidoreductase n=1 Tax=Streptomyces bambusae TaxID=1550616 RepID=UPI001CFE1F66|nr:SgcJ/EcaC family oxidoreductase [Streptomyces bambusae]MCB5165645.1 SgcJ/EcaC family oxidoreductase [Streptomyces bambusae]